MRFWVIIIIISAGILVMWSSSIMQPIIDEVKKSTEEALSQNTNTIPANLPNSAQVELVQDENGRTNALFLGIGGEGHIGENLTDTIMFSSFSADKERADVFSIPRDLAVLNSQTGVMTKINSLYGSSIDVLKNKIEDITGLPVHYYILIDFEALTSVIDIVGGISIPREETITDERFPTEDRGYETFEVQRGWRYLSGEEALKYVRTRNEGHGDFDRMRRQHEVLMALKNKIAGLHALKDLPTILNVYQALQNHFSSNATLGELQRLLDITKNFSDSNVVFHVISNEPDNLLTSSLVDWGGVQAYILLPNAGEENYSEIRKFIQDIINK